MSSNSETLDYNIVITARVKDKGQITWPPAPVDHTSAAKIKEAITTIADSTRQIFSNLPSTRVHCTVKFEPRTTVVD